MEDEETTKTTTTPTTTMIRAVVEAIHSSPSQAVLYLAGGASQVSSFFPPSDNDRARLILSPLRVFVRADL